MALNTGARLGPYEVLGAIGAGGMGEIYKARDTRLDRTVAIKVLPAHVVDDPVVRMRFERESKTIAALNHPHICTLYDVGEAPNPESGQGSIQFLVLELIEGESLADRLSKGPLPLDQALRYGSQVADALDRAHRQGIVHRDLKPGNIMLTKAGAKLLDFGLAKQAAPVATALGGLTTQTAGVITAQGTILGTCQYMAPEQLEGREADSRSDIWSFGAVLYEMVTGRTAFAGKSYVSLIGAILHRDPDPMSTLQPLSPPLLEHIVQTCLAKDPDDRWQSMADIRRAMAWSTPSGAHLQPLATGSPSRKATRGREVVAWALAAMMTLVAAAGLWFGISRSATAPAQAPVRFVAALPDNASNSRFAIISPDGRSLAFVANEAGRIGALFVRSMSALNDVRAIAGLDDVSLPFWSPDGHAIGFFSGSKLRWVDLANGVAQTICDAPSGRGGTWNRDNTILFASDQKVPLFRVAAAAGAAPVPVTAFAAGSQEFSHRLPSFLPDGRHFLLTALSEPGGAGRIKVGSLDSRETTDLIANVGGEAVYSEGFLLFGRDGSVFAQPFDSRGLKLSGDAVPILPAVRTDSLGWAAFSASETGLLVYRPPLPAPVTQLVWFSHNGAPGEAAAAPGVLWGWTLSPDNRRVAITRRVGDMPGKRTAVEVVDLAHGKSILLTSRPDTTQVGWSADSTRLVVSGLRGMGLSELYVLPADGSGAPAHIAATGLDSFPEDWSPDGKILLFRSLDTTQGGARYHLFTVPMPGDAAPTVFATDANLGRFSPDGRWIAFLATESGVTEVYVQPFPRGPRVAVTVSSQARPYWNSAGDEIQYGSQDKVMAVALRHSAESRIEIGASRTLFTLPPGAVAWAPTGDSQRFLVQVPVGERPAPPPLTVIVNWATALRK